MITSSQRVATNFILLIAVAIASDMERVTTLNLYVQLAGLISKLKKLMAIGVVLKCFFIKIIMLLMMDIGHLDLMQQANIKVLETSQ